MERTIWSGESPRAGCRAVTAGLEDRRDRDHPRKKKFISVLFGSLAIKMLFAGHGLLPCLPDDLVLVFGWRVDRVKLQISGLGGIYDVMFRTAGDHHTAPVFHRMSRAINNHFSLARFEPEELVNVVMCLFTDLLTGEESHQYQLAVPAGVQDPAKIRVFPCFYFEICMKTFLHILSSVSPADVWPFGDQTREDAGNVDLGDIQ